MHKLNLTRDGSLWLQHVLDPFKDLPVGCSGFPDTDCGASVVQVVKQSAQVYSTFGTNTWDCNMFLDTVATSNQLVALPVYKNGYAATTGMGGAAYANGGLIIRSANSGTNLDMTTTTQSLPLDYSYYNKSETRVIAMGFEVHNTTADLTKQGSVAYWRVPAEADTPSVITLIDNEGTSPCIPISYTCNTLQEPPNSLTEAVILPGTIQTEAAKGAYVVSVMSQESNPARETNPSFFNRTSAGVEYGNTIDKTPTTIPVVYTTGVAQEIPYCLGGAYFTGLSPTTTLTVNTVMIVERFVKANASQDLITLASPSAPFDPAALRIYSEVAKTLATGVPVSENGLGDWISGIASTIAKYAGPVLSGIGQAINHVNEQDNPRPAPRLQPVIVEEVIRPVVVSKPAAKIKKDNSRVLALEKQILELTTALAARATVPEPRVRIARVQNPPRQQRRNDTNGEQRMNPNNTQTWMNPGRRQPNYGDVIRSRTSHYR